MSVISQVDTRSMILFHSGIKAEPTRILYDYALKKFLEYYRISNPDELPRIEQKEVQIMLEDYLIYLRNQNKSRSVIKTFYNSLSLFLSMNDVICNWKKLKKMFPSAIKPRGQKPYSTEQVKQLLRLFGNSPKYYALVHFISASGVREGFSEELRIRHLTDMPNDCKAVKVYGDDITEYDTFIHQEAVKALNEYFEHRKKKGEKLTPDSWVFANDFDTSKPITTNDICAHFSHKVKGKIDRGELINGRYDIPILYGLRKRWDTIVKLIPKINPHVAEKLFGHSTTIPLDNNYFKPQLEQLFEEYQKAIPDLIIDDTFRLEQELKLKDEKIASMEYAKNRISYLENKVDEIISHYQNTKN